MSNIQGIPAEEFDSDTGAFPRQQVVSDDGFGTPAGSVLSAEVSCPATSQSALGSINSYDSREETEKLHFGHDLHERASRALKNLLLNLARFLKKIRILMKNVILELCKGVKECIV